jgi:hypothetical protein
MWQMLVLLLNPNTPVLHRQKFCLVKERRCKHGLINRCMLEEERHALAIVRPPASFGKLFMVSESIIPICIRLTVGLMSIVSIRSQSSFLSSCGTVLVTTIFLSLLPFNASIALPLKMPCVTMASTSLAPSAMSTSAALTSVPQVSAISSTRIAVLPSTSPTSTILETSLGRVRSLCMSAKPRFKPSAIDVALRED